MISRIERLAPLCPEAANWILIPDGHELIIEGDKARLSSSDLGSVSEGRSRMILGEGRYRARRGAQEEKG